MRTKSLRNSERGSGLIIVIILVAGLAALGMTLLTLTSMGPKMSGGLRSQEEAFNAAEAGFNAAQAVINWSIVPAQSIVAKNMKQLNMNAPLFQSHGFGNIKYVKEAGEAAEGIIFPCGRLLIAESLPANHPQKALLMKYKKDYESKYGEEASTFGGHAYDAMLILIEGIKKAGSDKDKVRDAIENLKGVAGTAGIFNFSPQDHNGLDINAFDVLTVKGGKFVKYE